MTDRQLIVVDLETSGLAPERHILEVAAVNVHTGEELYFAPHVDSDEFSRAEPEALQVNRYFERGVWQQMLTLEATRQNWSKLKSMLDGNTFGGSNPSFDAQRVPIEPVWHHRLADLAAFAAGAEHISPTDLPGLDRVCQLLDVENTEPHSALGDARATAACFRLLIERARP